MRGTSVKTTITLEIEVEVEGTYCAGSPAITSGPSDAWEPEDPDDVGVERVRACFPDRSIRDRNGKYYHYPEIPLWVMESIEPNFVEYAVKALVDQVKSDTDEAEIAAYESRREEY